MQEEGATLPNQYKKRQKHKYGCNFWRMRVMRRSLPKTLACPKN
uniref:Uncharacterized protein n=1 Tax=Rhizophora mucronata TaxID=61149 RepID=A0A2P2NPL8_RHIMU